MSGGALLAPVLRSHDDSCHSLPPCRPPGRSRCATGPTARNGSHTARIPQYAFGMADTTRITVTLPTEQVAELKKITDNISGFVAEAVARQVRHQLLGADLRTHTEEHGAFSEEELAEARARIFGTTSAARGASAA